MLPFWSARSEIGDRRPSLDLPCTLHHGPGLAAFCTSHPWAGSRLLSRLRLGLGDYSTFSFGIFFFSFTSNVPPRSFALSRSPHCDLIVCLPYDYSLCLAQLLSLASFLFKIFLPMKYHCTLPIDILALHSYMDCQNTNYNTLVSLPTPAAITNSQSTSRTPCMHS